MEKDKIEKVLFFKCGSCKNNLAHIFKKSKSKAKVFPAGVCCILHKDKGAVLFDTGYSKLVFENGLLSWAYNIVNPAKVGIEDTVDKKLKAYGIRRVDNIIISHGHPDHIGGLCFFPNSIVILTKEVLETIKKPGVRSFVFKNMGKAFTQKYVILQKRIVHPVLSKYFNSVYDVFQDGSILAIKLEGHGKGQLGLYLPEKKLFLAADSAWGNKYLCIAKNMRVIPRLIQHSYKNYLKTTEKIMAFLKENPQVTVVFSHSNIKEGEYGQ